MAADLDADVATLRAFNRTYTTRLGLLTANYDGSAFTLSEARILYELANRADPTAAELSRELGLDPAQLSRTIQRFAQRGLVTARENPTHGRHQLLSLTAEGRAAFAELEARTRAAVGGLLESLHPVQRKRLLAAAGAINEVFADGAPEVVFRGLRPGDLGMVVARQTIMYDDEYGWGADYEALIAGILADFHRDFDPARDDAWIACVGERMVGSIFLVHGDTPGVAKLRLLYLEPELRGLGVGKRLVAACIARAKTLGYGRMELWTNSVLAAARGIYEREGFKLVSEAPNEAFGEGLIGQTWALDLV